MCYFQVRELRNSTAGKERVLRRCAILLDEYKFTLEQAYFKMEKRTVPVSVAVEHDVTAGGAAEAANPGGVAVGGTGGPAQRRKSSVSVPAYVSNNNTGATEVVEIIAENEGMKAALKRLSDVLTPFLNEQSADVSNMRLLKAIETILVCSVYFVLNITATCCKLTFKLHYPSQPFPTQCCFNCRPSKWKSWSKSD